MHRPLPTIAFEFSAAVNPVPWKQGSLGTKRFGGKVVPTISPNAEMKAYQEALREQWQSTWQFDPIDEEVCLEWVFRRRLAQYRSATGRNITKKPCDISNLVKSSEDAIQPWLITNDLHVTKFSASWAYDDRLEAQNTTVEGGVLLTVRLTKDVNQ